MICITKFRENDDPLGQRRKCGPVIQCEHNFAVRLKTVGLSDTNILYLSNEEVKAAQRGRGRVLLFHVCLKQAFIKPSYIWSKK